jgi:hypothetical protein
MAMAARRSWRRCTAEVCSPGAGMRPPRPSCCAGARAPAPVAAPFPTSRAAPTSGAGPSIHDLDDDGLAEIIYGATVYRGSDGCLVGGNPYPAYSKGVVPVDRGRGRGRQDGARARRRLCTGTGPPRAGSREPYFDRRRPLRRPGRRGGARRRSHWPHSATRTAPRSSVVTPPAPCASRPWRAPSSSDP